MARERAVEGAPLRELYDLEADPEELHNLVDEQPELAAKMEQELETWIAERLKALGKDEDPLIKYGPSMRGTLMEIM